MGEGGETIFLVYGGHIELIGPPSPPTKENPGVWFRTGKNPQHTVTLVLHKQKVHLSIVSTIIFCSYTA